MSRQEDIRTNTAASATSGTAISVDTAVIAADTTSIDADTTVIAADTTAIAADSATIAADTTSIDADTTVIAADTTAINADTTAIAADAVLQTVDLETIAAAHRRTGFTAITSAVRTASFDSADFVNTDPHFIGVRLFVNVTEVGVAQTITIKVQIKDPISGAYHDLLAANTGALSATGTHILQVSPGIGETANIAVNDTMPSEWRLSVALNNGTNAGFSVHADYL